MNIISIEDEGTTAFFLKESLIDFNHKILGIFDNAVSLTDFLQETKQQIDLIFMDINMQSAENTREIFLNQYVYNIELKTLHCNDTPIALSLHEKNKINSLRESIFRLRKKLPSLEIISTPNIGYFLKVSANK